MGYGHEMSLQAVRDSSLVNWAHVGSQGLQKLLGPTAGTNPSKHPLL